MHKTHRRKDTLYRSLQTIINIGMGSIVLAALLLVQTPGAVAHAQMASAGTNGEPAISSISILPSDTAATIDWTTDEPSTSEILYGTSASYGSYSNLDTNDVTAHSEILTGLTPGATYYFQIVDTDISGNTNSSGGQTFTTIFSGEPATVSSTLVATVISNIAVRPSITQATISWSTDQLSNSQVLFGTTPSYGSSTTPDANEATNHSEILSNLMPGTTYYFEVVDEGMNSGMTSTSTTQSFTTLSNSDTIVPASTLSFQQLESAIAQLQAELASLQ